MQVKEKINYMKIYTDMPRIHVILDTPYNSCASKTEGYVVQLLNNTAQTQIQGFD
jgi:hypothetical protein